MNYYIAYDKNDKIIWWIGRSIIHPRKQAKQDIKKMASRCDIPLMKDIKVIRCTKEVFNWASKDSEHTPFTVKNNIAVINRLGDLNEDLYKRLASTRNIIFANDKSLLSDVLKNQIAIMDFFVTIKSQLWRMESELKGLPMQ